jgi:hypothetical protein
MKKAETSKETQTILLSSNTISTKVQKKKPS